VPLDGPPRLHCFLDPAIAPGYLAWVANDGEDTHIGVGGYAALFEPVQALEQFKSSLQGIADLRNATLIERRGGRIPGAGAVLGMAHAGPAADRSGLVRRRGNKWVTSDDA